MKDYNEMASAVFRRRDEYLTARKKRIGIIIKAGASVCALLLVAVVGIGVWKALPDIPSVKPTDPTVITTQSTQTQENPTASQQITDGTEQASQETTDTSTSAQQTPAGNIQEDTLPPDPTEPVTEKPSKPTGDVPQTNVKDPTQDNNSSAGDSWVDDPNEPPTCDDPTEAPMDGSPALDPTEAPTAAPTDSIEEPTECPTEDFTGTLVIECGGKIYEAQTGDMVTLTVELQADERISSATILAKYDYYYGRLEVIDLEELGFNGKQLREIHTPNIGNITSLINYNSGVYGRYRAVKVDFAAVGDEDAPDFTEKKVLFTFSFMVKKSGNTTIEIVPNEMESVNGTEYFKYGNQLVTEGIELDAYLTVTPASEVELPALPNNSEEREDIAFTYPDESTDGDLIINCDGRTYSANVGDTVTYVTELKADEMFINMHIILDYPEEYLKLNVPEKARIAFPNMYGMTANFRGKIDEQGNFTEPAVIMVANDIYGFDFTSRQVLVQLDFEVIKAGEIDLDLHFQDMYKYGEVGKEEPYFEVGVQKSFDDIHIYEYVLVESKSTQ